jgi:enoyl-CoA hydratase/carnithine racemase
VSIRVEQDSKVCRITLAAPQQKNVLDASSSVALLKALHDADQDPDVGAVLLESEGPVFCGGFTEEADLGLYGPLTNAKPLVVAMQGVALNDGLALLAAAHVAVAAQGSSFGVIEIREGRWNERLYARLAGAVGDRRASELYLSGRIFTVPEALNWGLVHQVAPAFELDDRATAVAQALANADTFVVRAVLARRR